jgi:hypothetical protein
VPIDIAVKDNDVSGKILGIVAAVQKGIDAAPPTMTTQISTKALEAQSARLQGLADAYGRGAGTRFSGGFSGGVSSKEETIKSAVTGVASKAVAALRRALKMRSPSRVTAEMGEQFGAGFVLGLNDSISSVGSAAARLALSAATSARDALQVRSPSRVFADIGRLIGEGLIVGIEDSQQGVEEAIGNAIDGAIDKSTFRLDKKQNAINDATRELFSKITGSDALGSGPRAGGTLLGQAGLTGSLNNFLSSFDANASRIFETNAKSLGELNASEREIFGTNLFSLNPNDVFGASNITGIVGFIDELSNYGDELLRQGTPLEGVRAALGAYVNDLVTTATNLGFNRDELLAMIDALGLSDDALASFIEQVGSLSAAANTAATNTKNIPGPDEPDAPDTPDTPDTVGPREVLSRPTFIINLPTGDPFANALAIANRQAFQARIPT